MKKLLLIAILMLALVFTVVACNDDPVTDGTTAADDTTVENPTEVPTEEPTEETPSEEVTTEEPEVTTEEPTETEAPTDAETTGQGSCPIHPGEDCECTAPVETTVDPADPVWIIEPDAINTIAQSKVQIEAQQIVSSEVITEGKYTFVRLIANGMDDPYVAIIPLNSNYTMPNYMAVKYRTNSANNGQFFMGSGAGWNGQGDFFGVDWNQNAEWSHCQSKLNC